jgi:hypothetical protein
MKALIFIMKIVAATLLLCMTGFCVFGFLASFELGWFSLWHCLYGLCGIGCLAGARRLLLCRTLARTWGSLALCAGAIVCILGLVRSYSRYFPWQIVGGAALGCGLLIGGFALLRWRGENAGAL